MDDPHAPPMDSPSRSQGRSGWVVAWIWLILKNILGWSLMLAAWPIGVLVPGPGGVPLFLIGFALVTFPGKRRFTARILRGRRLNLNRAIYTLIAAVVSVLIPSLLFWFVLTYYLPWHEVRTWGPVELTTICILVVGMTWLLARLSLRMLSGLITWVPRLRRMMRPWMSRYGVRLLPPRWRRGHPRTGRRHRQSGEEIIAFHKRHKQRIRRIWNRSRPWVIAVAIIAVAAGVAWIGWHYLTTVK